MQTLPQNTKPKPKKKGVEGGPENSAMRAQRHQRWWASRAENIKSRDHGKWRKNSSVSPCLPCLPLRPHKLACLSSQKRHFSDFHGLGLLFYFFIFLFIVWGLVHDQESWEKKERHLGWSWLWVNACLWSHDRKMPQTVMSHYLSAHFLSRPFFASDGQAWIPDILPLISGNPWIVETNGTSFQNQTC